MPIRFSDKLDALMVLADADAEARHDVEDGYVPDTPEEQWARAVATLADGEEHGDMLLISLMNAGYVSCVEVPVLTPNLERASRSPIYKFEALTDAGRAVAVDHGWVDTD